MPKRIAVIGAGPIGLEAALYAARAGFVVDVFERGRVAEHMLQWGHVRLFSPFGLICSRLLLPTPLTFLCKVLLDLLKFLFKCLLLCSKTLLFTCPLISRAARQKTQP